MEMLENEAMTEHPNECWCDHVAFSNLLSPEWGLVQWPAFISLGECVCVLRREESLLGRSPQQSPEPLSSANLLLFITEEELGQREFVGFIMSLFQHNLKWLFFKMFLVTTIVLSPSSIND